jgi:hypothetical protein
VTTIFFSAGWILERGEEAAGNSGQRCRATTGVPTGADPESAENEYSQGGRKARQQRKGMIPMQPLCPPDCTARGVASVPPPASMCRRKSRMSCRRSTNSRIRSSRLPRITRLVDRSRPVPAQCAPSSARPRFPDRISGFPAGANLWPIWALARCSSAAHACAMFSVDETTAAAIRQVFEESGELSAVVELRRHIPGIKDNAAARLCVRTIAGWKPLAAPLKSKFTTKSPIR